ncbi:unnamed protein product [Caenorhabditis sp. 36 PRJEB53466]|nr:unnamed protein product [Caenorhabditis sp. 36 PRJEB53466]
MQEDAAQLETGCTIIEGKTLVIKESHDAAALKERLRSITEIKHGVEIADTSFDTFDHLESVVSIENPDGPAIVFRGNSKLAHIKMGNLKKLKGKEHDVYFDKDHFPVAAYEDATSMADLLFLEFAARQGQNYKMCESAFLRVTGEEAHGFDWILLILGLLNAIGFIGAGAHLFYLMKGRKKEAQAKNVKKAGQEAKKVVVAPASKEHVPPSNSAEPVTGSNEPATGGSNEKENPKDK